MLTISIRNALTSVRKALDAELLKKAAATTVYERETDRDYIVHGSSESFSSVDVRAKARYVVVRDVLSRRLKPLKPLKPIPIIEFVPKRRYVPIVQSFEATHNGS